MHTQTPSNQGCTNNIPSDDIWEELFLFKHDKSPVKKTRSLPFHSSDTQIHRTGGLFLETEDRLTPEEVKALQLASRDVRT